MIFRIYFFAHFINIFSEAISRFPGFRLRLILSERSAPFQSGLAAYTIAKALKIIVTTIV
jgi:hypothetical protein